VRFTIADNGVGTPPDRLKRIFDAFFTTKEMVGTSLGLWVSKQILEKHGGPQQTWPRHCDFDCISAVQEDHS
jgi:signal transduction histidine kinase